MKATWVPMIVYPFIPFTGFYTSQCRISEPSTVAVAVASNNCVCSVVCACVFFNKISTNDYHQLCVGHGCGMTSLV